MLVYRKESIAAYGIGDPHPFGTDRHDVFHAELDRAGLEDVIDYGHPRPALVDELALFHTADYIDKVSRLSAAGKGWLDGYWLSLIAFVLSFLLFSFLFLLFFPPFSFFSFFFLFLFFKRPLPSSKKIALTLSLCVFSFCDVVGPLQVLRCGQVADLAQWAVP